jgi:hypothetical protein
MNDGEAPPFAEASPPFDAERSTSVSARERGDVDR